MIPLALATLAILALSVAPQLALTSRPARVGLGGAARSAQRRRAWVG